MENYNRLKTHYCDLIRSRRLECQVLDILDRPILEHCFRIECMNERNQTDQARYIVGAAAGLARKGVVDDAFPITLVEDLIDVHNQKTCMEWFYWMEQNQQLVLFNLVPNKGQSLVVLKICNGLLRRLSRIVHFADRGRILLFLARVFRLDEKSGLNLAGKYNTENIVFADAVESANECSIEQVLQELENDQILIDPSFYTILWRIQHYSSHLFLLHPETPDANDWTEFMAALDIVLKTMERLIPVTPVQYRQRIKYISARRVAKYQLRDGSFQSRLLYQLALLLEMLKSRYQSSTLEIATERIEAVAKRLQIIYHIFTNEVVKAYMHHLSIQETQWSQWKQDLCSIVFRDPVTNPIFVENDPKLWTIEPFSPKSMPFTVIDILEQRAKLPQLQDHFQPLKEQLQIKEMVREECRLDLDPVYRWSGLRIISILDPESICRTAAEGFSEIVQSLYESEP